jgi:hypothetical protein
MRRIASTTARSSGTSPDRVPILDPRDPDIVRAKSIGRSEKRRPR